MRRLILELELEDGEYEFLKELSQATNKDIPIIIMDFIRIFYYKVYQPLLYKLREPSLSFTQNANETVLVIKTTKEDSPILTPRKILEEYTNYIINMNYSKYYRGTLLCAVKRFLKKYFDNLDASVEIKQIYSLIDDYINYVKSRTDIQHKTKNREINCINNFKRFIEKQYYQKVEYERINA